MFGIFSLLNLLATTFYPILASYRAYDNYSRLATQTGATTVNLGGVSIPLGTMLKKATSSESNIEEDTMSYRLLHMQMWLVYWIVHSCVTLAEKLLFLKYLPLYTIFRLALSLWLVAPIIASETRTNVPRALTYREVQREWAAFADSGCGLVYFLYLKPFLDGHIHLIDNLRLDTILSTIWSRESKAKMATATEDFVMSEYDVVSKNDGDIYESIRSRKTSTGVTKDASEYAVDNKDSRSTAEVKPGWFW